jgi:8-oxo-dGTP pyrophosphatase MutT (NUDIX family)
VLLTERTHLVEDHKGQVAFPGGRVDAQDADRVATALREAEEEVGLKPEHVTVLGQIDELITVSQYRITPVVGIFPWPYAFTLQNTELSEVFTVPLAWLAEPANLEVRQREPLIPGRPIEVYYFHYAGHTIWGVTARIILNLLKVAGPLIDAGA